MAKVKIPLEVANGFMARNIEELKENFDIKKVVGYFLDGKLHKWLEDRYYDAELEDTEKLSATDESLADKLCEIFGVVQDTSSIVVDDILSATDKRKTIAKITDNENVIEQYEKLARDQNELNELLCKGEKEIYLCGGNYNIDLNYDYVKYIGLNNAKISLRPSDINKITNVTFENITFSKECKRHLNRMLFQKPVYWPFYSDEDGNLNYDKADFIYDGTPLEDIPKNTKGKIVDIHCCGYVYSAAAIDELGNIYTWGSVSKKSTVPKDLPKCLQIVCVYNGFFALGENGDIYGWGDTTFHSSWYEKEEKDGYVNNPLCNNMPPLMQIIAFDNIVFGLDESGNVHYWTSLHEKKINVLTQCNIKKLGIGLYIDNNVREIVVIGVNRQGKVKRILGHESFYIDETLTDIVDIGQIGNLTPVIDQYNRIFWCGNKEKAKSINSIVLTEKMDYEPKRLVVEDSMYVDDAIFIDEENCVNTVTVTSRGITMEKKTVKVLSSQGR